MKMIYPKVLIVSNKYDFSSDFVAAELNKRNIPYLRINRDELKDYIIEFNPLLPEIKGSYKEIRFTISYGNLKSIYFRAPTFLRDIFQNEIEEEEQLIRSQWAAFARSLCVFENVRWVNNPVYVYQAEIKPYQLFLANKMGFDVPESIISNKTKRLEHDYIALKSIDTAIINLKDDEGFVYTELYNTLDIYEEEFSSPFFLQQGLLPKVDIRVTVIGNNLIAIKIFDEKNIDIDWRKKKNELKYEIIELPNDLIALCINYVKQLNLIFGGIDLVLHNDKYYFIEINPTGEWSWLQQNTGFKIDKLLVDSLNV